jgi:hypothetical protein
MNTHNYIQSDAIPQVEPPRFYYFPSQTTDWQVCPLCNGVGKVSYQQKYGVAAGFNTPTEQCPVCNGKRIIKK